MRSKKLFFLFVYSLGLILSSCGEDRWPEYYPYTQRSLWVDSIMRHNYLWCDSIPSSKTLTSAYFKNPIDFLKEITKLTGENTSYIDTLYSNSNLGYGISYKLYSVNNSKNKVALITDVYSDSPAHDAGIERGEWITAINNDSIYNDDVFANGEQLNLTLGKYISDDNNLISPSTLVFSRQVVMQMPRTISNKGVYATGIFSINDRRIGYLCYSGFEDNMSDLLDKFSKFKDSRVNEFVLDLRYNQSGFSTDAFETLATMLVPSSSLGQNFSHLKFNKYNQSKERVLVLGNTSEAKALNLDLKRIFIITGEKTSGLAEAFIYCMKPFLDVIALGSSTAGKGFGTEFYANANLNLGLYLVTYVAEDKNGDADYFNSISPSKQLDELSNLYQVLPLGNPNELLLQTAINMAIE